MIQQRLAETPGAGVAVVPFGQSPKQYGSRVGWVGRRARFGNVGCSETGLARRKKAQALAFKRRHHFRDARRCKRGHPFTPETTRITKAGYRQCRLCVRECRIRKRLSVTIVAEFRRSIFSAHPDRGGLHESAVEVLSMRRAKGRSAKTWKRGHVWTAVDDWCLEAVSERHPSTSELAVAWHALLLSAQVSILPTGAAITAERVYGLVFRSLARLEQLRRVRSWTERTGRLVVRRWALSDQAERTGAKYGRAS